MKHISVVIADDHLLARKGIKSILSADPAFEVVGEAADAFEAVASVAELKPDLVLMDLRMPGGGLPATRKIKRAHPDVKVVVVTVSDDAQDLFEAIRTGAQGYLLKNLAPQEWLGYLRSIMDDNAPISRSLASRILRKMRLQAAEPGNGSDADLLTERELQVLRYVARGLTNKEVAQALHISENTVKNHLKRILGKLNLMNRTQLTQFAFKRGLLPTE